MKRTTDITIACKLNTQDKNAMTDIAENADYFVKHALIDSTEIVDAHAGNSTLIVRLFFTRELDDLEIQEAVSECDYEIAHDYVTSTEITDLDDGL